MLNNMKKIFSITLISILLISCKSIKVASDYDSQADFNNYKTYAFYKPGIDELEISDIDKKRIQSHQSVNLYDFTDRFCHKLKLSQENINHIKKISNICDNLSLTNDNTPPAMSSGCIYLYIKYNNIDISKKEISDICKISEVTINKCFKKIENIKEINDYLKEL